LSILSHPRTFKRRPRTVIRAVCEESFQISQKQRMALDKWPIPDSSARGSEDVDVTTDKISEDDCDFDSDY
jgi:hypothetical protein